MIAANARAAFRAPGIQRSGKSLAASVCAARASACDSTMPPYSPGACAMSEAVRKSSLLPARSSRVRARCAGVGLRITRAATAIASTGIAHSVSGVNQSFGSTPSSRAHSSATSANAERISAVPCSRLPNAASRIRTEAVRRRRSVALGFTGSRVGQDAAAGNVGACGEIWHCAGPVCGRGFGFRGAAAFKNSGAKRTP